MTATTETWNGLIKLKLVHRRGASVLLPDVLVGGSEHQHWIQPQYFYAPILALGEGLASFTLAALDPTGDDDAGHECHVRFSAGDLVAHFADGSLLYRCRVESQLDAVDLSIGQSRLGADNRLELLCFHHTSGESLNAIQSSATLQKTRQRGVRVSDAAAQDPGAEGSTTDRNGQRRATWAAGGSERSAVARRCT